MGIHKLPQIELYCSDNFIFKNQLSNIISKAKFKFLCCVLHLSINDKDLVDNDQKNENDVIFDNNEENDEKQMKKMKAMTQDIKFYGI